MSTRRGRLPIHHWRRAFSILCGTTRIPCFWLWLQSAWKHSCRCGQGNKMSGWCCYMGWFQFGEALMTNNWLPDLSWSLSPDLSETGIGYFLSQKHCECPSDITTCCQYGWCITLAGSRFLNEAEPNYWPVEGEALAVALAVEDTRYFTMGFCNLHIQTDHHLWSNS